MKAEDRKGVWYVVGIFVVGFGVFIPLQVIADATPTPRSEPPRPPKGETNCPLDLRDLAVDRDGFATCWCDGKWAYSEVAYGTAQYSAESTPCAAAMHAGVLSRFGANRVTFKQTAPCTQYTGTKMNDQSTLSTLQGRTQEPSFIVPASGASASCSQTFNHQ